ncbi:aminoacyl tRNA synthase complex-interacting multifunctional protein 2 isoform X2 [Leptopilina boulardi]|uniref:aminoacyl tRNA synthase complex-interacting multifunctional protein 2 isoform X2 n=1 Tax=Leptopilina boulardi TaxID=63433 RepID=UPI0021F55CEB|nr:aminoacyl tRNA synthase complex-interacting multifunctional protein 2 isoform X2 [Leptopilina boulardi]
MSGPVAMYTLKPIMPIVNLSKQNKVMYEMNNIHEIQQKIIVDEKENETIVTEIKDQENSAELKILEQRQEKILSQLAEIKQQVAIFRDVLKQSNAEIKTTTSTVPVIYNPVTIDIILNANPKKPPFSILALSKIWKDSSFQIQTHVHSSIIENVPEFLLTKNEENIQKNCINLRLIWRDVPDLTLKCGLTTSSIEGEGNFLRYLSRLVKNHSYENSDPIEATKIDSILDFCHYSLSQSTKDVQSTILRLNDYLTKGPWLLNKIQPTIIDVAVWSLCKRLNLKLTSPTLAKWFQQCEKTFV